MGEITRKDFKEEKSESFLYGITALLPLKKFRRKLRRNHLRRMSEVAHNFDQERSEDDLNLLDAINLVYGSAGVAIGAGIEVFVPLTYLFYKAAEYYQYYQLLNS